MREERVDCRGDHFLSRGCVLRALDLGKFVIVQRLYLAHAPRLSRRPPRASS